MYFTVFNKDDDDDNDDDDDLVKLEIYTRTFPKIFSSKKILSTNQNAELTTGIHTFVFFMNI